MFTLKARTLVIFLAIVLSFAAFLGCPRRESEEQAIKVGVVYPPYVST
jgi:hypothetical protein